jgi:quercetin dioxygenase-like cupin family protein
LGAGLIIVIGAAPAMVPRLDARIPIRDEGPPRYLMAIPDVQPGEVIDVRPLGPALAEARTTHLVKAEGLEILRLVVPRDKAIPTHQAKGAITVQCLEGRVTFTVEGVPRDLQAGQLLYLREGQPHSLRGIEDSSLLVTKAMPRPKSTAV